jgi:Holliday junction resolvase RusA-like endonuclease
MSTSFVKFLDAKYRKAWNAVDNVTLNKSSLIQLLKEWQKTLRVNAGASKELNEAKKVFMLHFAKKRPDEPLDGTYQLTVVFTFPWLKGHGKRLQERCRAIRKNTKPDTDNLVKVFKDCLEKSGCIVNDSRIARETVEKRHGDDIGIQYVLKPIESEIPRVVEERPF